MPFHQTESYSIVGVQFQSYKTVTEYSVTAEGWGILELKVASCTPLSIKQCLHKMLTITCLQVLQAELKNNYTH